MERKKEKILNWSTNTPSEQFVVLCLRSLRKRRRTTVTFAFLLLECFSNPRVGIYFSVTSPFVVTTKNTTLSATLLFCCPTETLALHPRNQKKSNFSFNYFSILSLSLSSYPHFSILMDIFFSPSSSSFFFFLNSYFLFAHLGFISSAWLLPFSSFPSSQSDRQFFSERSSPMTRKKPLLRYLKSQYETQNRCTPQ